MKNRLQKYIKDKDIDLALILNLKDFSANLLYFSGFDGVGCLLTMKNSPPILVVPKMELQRAKKSANCKVVAWPKGKKLFEFIYSQKKSKLKQIAIPFNDFSVLEYKALRKSIKNVKILDISEECLNIRSIKTPSEVILLKKSCNIANAIMKKTIQNFNKFKTETDVASFLHKETIRHGCDLAFPTIVASGPAASMPHYEPQNVKIKKGFCVIDFGVKYKGYHSDMTRTIYLGSPTKKEKEMYELLAKTQTQLIKNITVNKKCKDSYKETISLLGKYSKYFTHGLGHGIGLQIHELPNISLNAKDIFKNNVIFTIEPGIYIPKKLGIRIEDDILISKGKVEVLTKFPKNLIIR